LVHIKSGWEYPYKSEPHFQYIRQIMPEVTAWILKLEEKQYI